MRFQVDQIKPEKNQLFEESRVYPANARLLSILIRPKVNLKWFGLETNLKKLNLFKMITLRLKSYMKKKWMERLI